MVPPWPAVFSRASTHPPGACSKICSMAAATRESTASKPLPMWEPVWRTTPSAPRAVRDGERVDDGVDRLRVLFVALRGKAHQVAAVQPGLSEPGLLAKVAEALVGLGLVLRLPPGAGRGAEELYGLGLDRDGALDRLPEPARGGAVGADRDPRLRHQAPPRERAHLARRRRHPIPSTTRSIARCSAAGSGGSSCSMVASPRARSTVAFRTPSTPASARPARRAQTPQTSPSTASLLRLGEPSATRTSGTVKSRSGWKARRRCTSAW